MWKLETWLAQFHFWEYINRILFAVWLSNITFVIIWKRRRGVARKKLLTENKDRKKRKRHLCYKKRQENIGCKVRYEYIIAYVIYECLRGKLIYKETKIIQPLPPILIAVLAALGCSLTVKKNNVLSCEFQYVIADFKCCTYNQN